MIQRESLFPNFFMYNFDLLFEINTAPFIYPRNKKKNQQLHKDNGRFDISLY